MIDKSDLVIAVILVFLFALCSTILSIHHTDKEVCKLKNGVLVGGECISVEAVKQ